MSMYFSPAKALSYNALFNFVIGERGVGKTTGVLKFFVNDFLKNGHQFVYIRRYVDDLSEADRSLFDNLKAMQCFPEDTVFEVKKKKAGSEYYINGELAGFGIPLTQAIKYKSRPFPNVYNIVYDEFLLIRGTQRYIPNEVTVFLELYETIARLRDNVRVFFLGNAGSATNPYFRYFKLSLPYGSEAKLFKNGTILVYYSRNEAYRAAKKATRFGQIIDGSAYGDYAIDNKFFGENAAFIRKKTGKCSDWFNITIDGTTLGVWSNYEEKAMYISSDITKEETFVLTKVDHSEDTTLISNSDIHIRTIMEYYRNGHLFFDNQQIKEKVVGLILPYFRY